MPPERSKPLDLEALADYVHELDLEAEDDFVIREAFAAAIRARDELLRDIGCYKAVEAEIRRRLQSLNNPGARLEVCVQGALQALGEAMEDARDAQDDLAALRKRIEDAPAASVYRGDGWRLSSAENNGDRLRLPSAWRDGQRVRLVRED